jgi:hypothetical protein
MNANPLQHNSKLAFSSISLKAKDYNTENMDDVIELLNERKEAFLDDIESEVRIYIKSTGKQCIALVEKDSSSGAILKTWKVHLNDDLRDFCKVLYKFVRKEQYHGHDLDSALTEPMANMVETAYQDFYKSESEAISRGMLVMLAADELTLVASLIESPILRSTSSRSRSESRLFIC